MFEIQQQVVCVDAHFSMHVRSLYDVLPRRGKTYTIRDLKDGTAPEGGYGEPAIYLVEIHSPTNSRGVERGFLARRFAPLQPVRSKPPREATSFFGAPLPDLEPALA